MIPRLGLVSVCARCFCVDRVAASMGWLSRVRVQNAGLMALLR